MAKFTGEHNKRDFGTVIDCLEYAREECEMLLSMAKNEWPWGGPYEVDPVEIAKQELSISVLNDLIKFNTVVRDSVKSNADPTPT